MKRTEIRELAFKLLYSLEIQNETNLEEQIEIYVENNEIKQTGSNHIAAYITDCGMPPFALQNVAYHCIKEHLLQGD